MNDMPVPGKNFRGAEGKWGPALAALLEGKTIYIPGLDAPTVVGGLKRSWMTDQGFTVRSRMKEGGTVAWIQKR